MTGPEDLGGKVAIVTGGTGGMGREIALGLTRAGARVIVIARDARRSEDLARLIDAQGHTGRLETIGADLSTRAGIRSAVEETRRTHDTIDILVNNAGAHFGEHRLSADGIEMHVAIDYLASFGLTTLLRDELTRGGARVVNVASDTLRDTRQIKLSRRPRPATVDIEGLRDLTRLSPKHGFAPFEAYGRAKLLTVTAGYGLARRLASDGVTVNSVHPGIVATGIIDDLIPKGLMALRGVIRRSMLTPEQGAAPALRLATDAALSGVTGRYFVRDLDTPTPRLSYCHTVQDLLLETSDRFFGADSH